MTTHKWHVVIPGPICTSDGMVYLDSEEISLPLTSMDIHMRMNEPVEISATVIPLGGLDALLTFSEENPLVAEIHWPQCPHCGKFYNKESIPAKLTIPPAEEKPPFDWGEDHRRANRRFEEESNGCD